MTPAELSNPVIRDAMSALVQRDREEWLGMFHPDARIDDGFTDHVYTLWSDDFIFEPTTFEVLAIIREDPDGDTVYTRINSTTWGEMNAFWRFTIENGEITHLRFGGA
jgi:hypothetical protein